MIRIQQQALEIESELEALEQDTVGAVASFTGVVRGGDGITEMEIECYLQLAQNELERIANEARKRWRIEDLRIWNRYGRLQVGERILFVACASEHRRDAFESCAFIVDKLKLRAPFWKKEIRGRDCKTWVEANLQDLKYAERWH